MIDLSDPTIVILNLAFGGTPNGRREDPSRFTGSTSVPISSTVPHENLRYANHILRRGRPCSRVLHLVVVEYSPSPRLKSSDI